MPTPPVNDQERLRRKIFMERLVADGYTPLGAPKGELPSAAQEGKRRDGVNYARWIRDEEKARAAGKRHFVPNFIGCESDEFELKAEPVRPEVTPKEHAQTRARKLASELAGLVTGSKYPLINPEAIVVESFTTRRYDRRLQDYVEREGTPRTWLSDTLRVAPKEAKGRKFLLTSAQNDAPVHEGFWHNLEAYAGYLGAEIIVGPFTYETSWWNETNTTSRSYDPLIKDHLCFGQMAIGSGFVFAAEMNTLPTASQPISDLVTYSRGRWAVFPHPKRQLKSVPSTDPGIQAHQVMTTGCCTIPKVVPRKAGIKSIFHAVIGAVIVEFDEDENVFARQITASEDGSFYDLDLHVSDEKVTRGHPVKAVVFGDLHLRKLDRTNAMASFGFDLKYETATYRDSLIEVLRPEYVLLHDVFDNETRNHHHVNDVGHSYEMAIRGRDNVFDEVREVSEFLEKLKKPGRNILVIESNHDIGLERYIREGRYRGDGLNARIGLQLEDAYLQHRERVASALDAGKKPPSFSMLEHAVRRINPELEHVEWIHDGKSKLIDEIEVGHHGFRGVNGSKGTVVGFARAGRKLTVADKHSPEINEGVYVAGCMNLQHGYNKGPSSWAVSHVVQYNDGKRAIITLQSGKWRANKPRVSVKAAA